MFFLVWRFQKRLEHYSNMKGPFYGGEYSRCPVAYCLRRLSVRIYPYGSRPRLEDRVSERVVRQYGGTVDANRNFVLRMQVITMPKPLPDRRAALGRYSCGPSFASGALKLPGQFRSIRSGVHLRLRLRSANPPIPSP